MAENFKENFSSVDMVLENLEILRSEELRRFDLLVNATSVGMGGSSFPGLSLYPLPPDAAAFDMVYVPPRTSLLDQAHAQGVRGANGLGMLVGQGEETFAIWTGQARHPGLMRRILNEHLDGH